MEAVERCALGAEDPFHGTLSDHNLCRNSTSSIGARRPRIPNGGASSSGAQSLVSGSRCVGHLPLKGAPRRRSISCAADIKKSTDTSSCEPHLKTAMGGRHHPAQQRQYHAKRRLAELRATCPDPPEDILSCLHLRELSFAVRHAGRGRQSVLRVEAKAQEGNGNEMHAQPEAEVRSTTENLVKRTPKTVTVNRLHP